MISLKQFVLQPMVEKAKSVVSEKLKASFSNILFETKDGVLFVSGTDGIVSISCSTALVDSDKNYIFLVDSKKVMDLVKTLPSDADIDIKIEEDSVGFYSGKSMWMLPMYKDVEEFPDMIYPGSVTDWKSEFEREPFLKGLNRVIYAVSRKSEEVGRIIQIKKGRAKAHEGVGKYHEADVGCSADISILAETADHVLNLLRLSEAPDVRMTVFSNYFIMEVGDDLIKGGLPVKEFRDLGSAVEDVKQARRKLITNKSDLVDCIKRVSIMADPRTNYVELHISEKELTVKAETSTGGVAKDTIEAEWNDVDCKLCVNCTLLQELISTIGAANFCLTVTGDLGSNKSFIGVLEDSHCGFISQVITN